jgi:uncharacterized membrane protein YhhN
MTGISVALLAVTMGCAVVDWVAVGTGRRGLEYVFKPATLTALIAVALTLDPTSVATRRWFVIALAFCLAGDILLMLPRNLFVAGLASFLVGHVAYVIGFVVDGVSAVGLALGLLVVLAAVVLLARRIVVAVSGSDEPALMAPVVAYIGVISAMVVSAFGTLEPAAVGGSLLFYASDALIAWNRFVREQPHGRLAVIVTYHLGQVALVLSLVS